MTLKNQGFTLLELLVTIAIAGILVSVAVPSFYNLIANSNLTSTTNSLVGAFNLARSEAIEAGQPVIVELTGGGAFQIRNVTTDTVLRSYGAPASGVTITAAGDLVTYQANGYRTFGGGDFTLEVCNDLGDCRTVTVSSGGSVSVVTP